MKDIAHELGVSVVTVSKVLRNHSDISDETRERVLRRIKELNYRPNLAARALVTGRTCTVGLIVPDLVHPFFAQVAKGLSRVLRKKGYSVVISSSEEDTELEQQEVDQLLARRVDALLIASAQWTVDTFRRIEEQQVPYVLIDRFFAGLTANFVGVDDQEAGRLAVEHLIDQGCQRIAHIRGPEVSTAIGRAEGYRQALAAHGITLPPTYVIRSRGDDAADASGYAAMQQLLKVEPRPDAVFCYNDPIAMGAMKANLESGLRVPGDIAVVGCGNVNYAELLRIPLSSVDQNSGAIGERAAKLALSLIEAKAAPRPRRILLKPTLIVRDSSRKHDVNALPDAPH
jgi:LacI family transcriptional regulator